MTKSLLYILFAIFALTMLYSYDQELGTTLAVLSLVILLINRAKVFSQYLG